MNVRSKRKATKKAVERMDYFKSFTLYLGRRNGKSYLMKQIIGACCSKKYKPFKELKKYIKVSSEGD